MSYNFDLVIDRTATGDLKHCVLQERYGRSDLLPLWVADMDFATPPFITDAMKQRLEHSLFGYTVVPEAFWESIISWEQRLHGWHVEREWLAFIPGIVKGIGMAINVLLRDDERVIIQPPVYHPFRLVPMGNHREVVTNPLIETAPGTYAMNLVQLEELARDPRNRMLVLSNPHNPAGIVWDRGTLERVAEICDANGVIVVSDEIHADMALFGHRHTPFATVSEAAARCSITFGAPSKTFNIAGIVSSFAIVPNASLRSRFFHWLKANEMDEPTLFAPIATIAAYTDEGDEWRRQMLAYVEANIVWVESYCRDHLSGVVAVRPQASFLVWLDCRGLGLDHKALVDLFVNKAHLALNDGEMFGQGGEGFMRLNVGTPRSVLQQAMQQLEAAIATL